MVWRSAMGASWSLPAIEGRPWTSRWSSPFGRGRRYARAMGRVKAAARLSDLALSGLAQDPPPNLYQRHENGPRRPCRIADAISPARHGRLAARPCDGCIMVGEALRGLVTTMWRARFWRGRERSVISGVPARTTVAYRQSRRRPVRQRGLGTGAIPCPITPAMVAICGYRV